MAYPMTTSQWLECRVVRTEDKPRALTNVNRKGGSGKTTTAVQLGAVFAAWGLNVRLVDGDAQLASSTYWLPPQIPRGYPTLLDVFLGTKTIDEVTAPTSVPGLSIVPSLDTLLTVDTQRPAGSDTVLRLEYDQSELSVDLEIQDAAPALGIVTVSMLAAATDVAVMARTSTLDRVGAAELAKPIDLIKRRLNPSMRISLVLLVGDDARTSLSRGMVRQFHADYPQAMVYQIPHSVSAAEAPGAHETMISYAPDNPVTHAYWNLAAALVPVLGLEWKVSPEMVMAR